MFSGLSVRPVSPFVRPDRSCHHDISSDERRKQSPWNYREYLTASVDDLTGFWRSRVKVTVGRRGGEGIPHPRRSPSSSLCYFLRLTLLPRDAMLGRYMLSSCVHPYVRQSVCLSHAGIVSKRLNKKSHKQRFGKFSDSKDFSEIPTGSPPTGAPNKDNVRDARHHGKRENFKTVTWP